MTPRELVLGQPASSTTRDDMLWAFGGHAGQVIDIAMTTADPDFDPYLTLQQADGMTLTEDDNGGGGRNARIAPFILPADGRYLVKTLRPDMAPSTAPYTLTLAALTPRELVLGQPASSTTQSDMLWSFEGQAGQVVDIAMTTADPDFDPYLTLQQADGMTLTEDDNGGGGRNARIAPFILPADGRYLVKTRPHSSAPSTAPYTLTLAALTPRKLVLGQPAPSTTQSDMLWAFEGQSGQIIDLAMTTADPSFDPYLTLQQADGVTLAEDDNGGEGRNARIAPFFLPADGRYLVNTRPPGSALSTAPYTLTLAALTPREFVLGQPASSTTRDDMLWAFGGHAGQVVDIAMTTADPDFDPYLTLRDADGATLAKDDNSGENANALIPTFVLTRTATYYIEAGPRGSTAPYQLSLTSSPAQPLAFGSPIPVERSGVFTFSGQSGQLVAMGTDPSANLALLGLSGLLAGQAPAILTRLVATSTYTVAVSLPPWSSSTTLQLDTVSGDVRSLAFDQLAQSQMQPEGIDVWSFADAGERAVEVTVTPTAGDLDLELYAPDGTQIASGVEANRLLSVLPTGGDYLVVVRPRSSAAAGPYTITLKPSETGPGPQACGRGESPGYGPVRVGTSVILGRHRAVNGETSWDEAMAQYVGRTAIVTGLMGTDGTGCPLVHVDIDGGRWYWRIRDMLIVP